MLTFFIERFRQLLQWPQRSDELMLGNKCRRLPLGSGCACKAKALLNKDPLAGLFSALNLHKMDCSHAEIAASSNLLYVYQQGTDADHEVS